MFKILLMYAESSLSRISCAMLAGCVAQLFFILLPYLETSGCWLGAFALGFSLNGASKCPITFDNLYFFFCPVCLNLSSETHTLLRVFLSVQVFGMINLLSSEYLFPAGVYCVASVQPSFLSSVPLFLCWRWKEAAALMNVCTEDTIELCPIPHSQVVVWFKVGFRLSASVCLALEENACLPLLVSWWNVHPGRACWLTWCWVLILAVFLSSPSVVEREHLNLTGLPFSSRFCFILWRSAVDRTQT